MTNFDDILDFLPHYPNISENTKFDKDIYLKKEFYENKLESMESIPEKKGSKLKHQELIARFLSPYTNYNELLLLHEMGTGKSCSAISIAEMTKEVGNFKGVLYLAKGDTLIENFKNELVYKCTDGRYIPQQDDELDDEKKPKIKLPFYKFDTFEIFAKNNIINKSEKEISKYNNYVIILDEVHNLRLKTTTGETLNLYNDYKHFLHTVKGCKILLLSGTPMKNSVAEISSIMNLILHTEEELPTDKNFMNEYFEKRGEIFEIKTTKVKELKEKFKGRVSYLRAMVSDVQKKFIGDRRGSLEYFKVVEDVMSDFQSEVYINAYKLDTNSQKNNKEKQGVYSNSRQASLFVFPDKSYGSKGFSKYVISTRTFTNKTVYKLSSSLSDMFRNKSDEEKLKIIEKYSVKYANTIRVILNARESNKCVFVYNEYVYGGGLLLFGFLLQLFGFSRSYGTETTESSRYALLTGSGTSNKISRIIERFNKSDNVHGKYINVIMGSRKISEGFSFKHIQVIDIQTPWYNYAETSQVIGRGIRFGSHEILKKFISNPVVEIYQRVSIPESNTTSIDLQMYETSEIKDFSIKAVERLIKESSFDCALNYKRNKLENDIDHSRECEYTNCDYKCDGISDAIMENPNPDLDYSTYQLYYSNTKKIIDVVNNIFRIYFELHFNEIKTYLIDYTDFEIITALRQIIVGNLIIFNKYGFQCYLGEKNNIYFLTYILYLNTNPESEYYVECPHILNSFNTFSNIIDSYNAKYLPEFIEKLFSVKSIDDISAIASKIPPHLVSYIIEQSLIARLMNENKNKNSRNLLLKYYNTFYTDDVASGVIFLSYLYKTDDKILKCLDKNSEKKEWEKCSDENEEKYLKLKDESTMDIIKDNKYGYYGQINNIENKFCIRDISSTTKQRSGNKDSSKNTQTSGKVCDTWDKNDLYDLITTKLKIDLPVESILKKSKNLKNIDIHNAENLKRQINKVKTLQNVLERLDYEGDLSREDMLNVIYWGSKTKPELCSEIKSWLDKNELLVPSNDCGKSDKKKVK